jgi:hypothetical protein
MTAPSVIPRRAEKKITHVLSAINKAGMYNATKAAKVFIRGRRPWN